ncbi:ABC transporter ATP-binding protein [Lacihabitans sp. CS3-21]|jgi:phospholipid/cholesterol/gamma-HCH transport system ATP-binding protein|uniref:ABC transporter ATP-binding protein n=1 Tax=Lacihabitans sp. CS3-21 TaxID=2487332 RepID=UPI000BDBBBB2|nr:ATP-binding cassette domain-containing protein [Lacihabitans sp. CS3-21]MCP9747482.1 ATP-binding cassette domain-containing protein [Lacihabitans sp. CS3-21]MDP1813181.1 ATP-binding cassette domain-containing protein [Leadbetterella sp.]OYU67706.1 MAG: ABC transporter ATP-binding protein [Cytophagaceae bacterium BCCC1]
MIEIKNISKAFNGKVVLENVSGIFKKGETSLVIGASGTGKSVLLKCMLDLVEPESGDVFFDGREFLHISENDRKDLRREMGVLFQGGALFDSKTVHQNIKFPLDMLTKMSEGEKNDRVEFCLHKVGLDGTGPRMPSEISGGMKKRVGIARAIVMNPKYLFCDEPNSGLDPLTSIKIDELIKEITDDFNITTVVITHDMNSVLSIGDNIMFLYKGKKIWEGDSTTIMTSSVKELDEFVFSNHALKKLRGEYSK